MNKEEKRKKQLEQSQQDSRQQLLSQGSSLEILVRQDQWKLIKEYFQAKVQAFTSSLLTSGEPIEKFEDERQRIKGIRDMFGWIEGCIKAVEDDREKASEPTKK